MHTNEKEIQKLFRQKNGYVRTKDLLQIGIYHTYLNPFLEAGTVIKVKHGLYTC
jgi:hypothetical protein